jgi:hypothetical protein
MLIFKKFDGIFIKKRILNNLFHQIKIGNFSLKKTEYIDITSFSNTKDLIEEFGNKFPVKLNKKKVLKSDINLTSFVPFDKIINKTKAIAISKNFIENLISYVNTGKINYINEMNSYCENKFVHKIFDRLQDILNIRNEEEPVYSYKIFLKTKENNSLVGREINLKKLSFNVNLYNIKNYLLLGLDSNRETKKNLKFVTVNKDILLNKFFSSNEQKNQTTSIKTDIYSLKITQNNFGEINNLPMMLVSQFEFSLLPSKAFYICIEVQDKLNETKILKEYKIEMIDFIVECELLKIKYSDINELNTKINEVKSSQKKDENEEEIKGEEEDNLKLLQLLNSDNIEEKFNYNLKIIDVDGYLNGNDIL